MNVRSLPWIAFRNLVRHARQSAFALAAIVFGVAGLALADGFIRDVFVQLGEATVRAQLGHVQLARSGFSDEGAGRPESFVIEHPETIRRALATHPGVDSVTGRLHLSGVASANDRELPVEVEGVEPTPESATGAYLKLLDGVDLIRAGAHSALIGEGVARQLRLRAGDYLYLTGATLDGSLNAAEFSVAGIFRSFSKDFDDRAIRIALGEAQDLVQANGVHAIVVTLKHTEDTDRVLAGLRALPLAAGMEVQPWYELSDFYASTRALYARQFGILQLIALVLIAMSVLTSANITVFERTAELGTMRALGARSRVVVALMVLESALLGAVGAVIGVVVALALGALLSSIGIEMPPPPNAEAGFTAHILITSEALAKAAAVGVASAVLGALVPSFRVSRLPIVTALGHRF